METVVHCKNLTVIFKEKPVLEGITFSASPGEILGIIGPNGAGKTTLLRVILGLVSISDGELKVFGLPPNRLNAVRSKLGYMPQRQHFERRFPLSVSDVVTTGLLTPEVLLRSLPGKKELVEKALKAVGMENLIRLPFQELSGGEQQRVLLARSIVREPSLLLLDEPGTGLDFPAQKQFMMLLQALRDKMGLTILLVSHDLLSASAVADKLLCINRFMHIHGLSDDVMKSSRLEDAYQCHFALLRPETEKEGPR